jgi:periplasmic protein TonB
MPQELLRSASSVARSPRRWFMLPLSIAAHGAVALVVLGMPLTAAGDLPIPGPPSGIVRFVTLAPPPPPVQIRRDPLARAERQPALAPTVAPPALVPERPEPASVPPGPPVDGALPAEFGVDGGVPTAAPLLPPPPPPLPVPEVRPVRPGGQIREPKRIVDVAPVYPRIAQTAQVQGIVILEAIIGTDGRVDGVRVLRSVPLLDEAAIAAVKQWRYTPTLLNNVPVPVLMTITVKFHLR